MSDYRVISGDDQVRLIEDEYGIRWWLCCGERIDESHWRRMQADPQPGIVSSRVDDTYSVVSWDTFAEHASTKDGWVLSRGWTHGLDAFPAEIQAGVTPAADIDDIGFVHLHTHTEFSLLDGMTTTSELLDVITAQGGKYVGCADHGNVAVHPDLQKACDLAGVTPVFGMEAYLVDDRHRRMDHFPEEEPKKADYPTVKAHTEATVAYRERRAAFRKGLADYWHLCLFATDQTGLHNLWAMSTEAFRDGLYSKNPRLDWDTLRKYSEGVIATTACLRGPLWHNGMEVGRDQEARTRLATLMDIFPDRLYVEIHANQLPVQRECNTALVSVAREHHLPLVAAVDAHYAKPEQKHPHQVWLSVQTNREVDDDSTLFAGNQDYHLADEAEVRASLAYLPGDVVDEAIRNTAVIAVQSTARIEGKPTPPVYSKGGIEEDRQRLLDLCLSNWHRTEGKRYDQDVYLARFEREFDMISRKGFCGYFLMTADMTNHARANGILVGPGRGSGGGSLVAYLASITDIDSVDADLPFERFMTEGRIELPDFDIDYPASRKQFMQQYVWDKYGADAATVVGSILRLKNKGVIDKIAKALGDRMPDTFAADHKVLREIVEDAEADTAGLGMSWEDLCSSRAEELAPYRARYPELFAMCDELVGRVNTFGQHAAGMVISAEGSLNGRLPMRRAKEDGHMIAQFDKDVLEELGFVKFDLLTISNLDTIQETIDLIKERRGLTIDPYSWREQYEDPQIWEEVSNAHTLGLFQINTNLGTAYAARVRPQSLHDLADLVTIVRPGPRNSGLTESYLKRRDGREEVSFPDPRLTETLSRTYGTLLYQEDIMATVMILAGYNSNEADAVRKILGKKKVDKVAAAGKEFIERAVAMGMDRNAANNLWSQMAEFAKYSFNRSHAFAYAVLCGWCAWLKFHFPIEFLLSGMNTVDAEKLPAFITEARRMGYQVLPPDINASGAGFTADGLVLRYGVRMKGVGEDTAKAIMGGQPYTSFDDFMARMVEPKGSPVNRGVVAALAHIGAFDSLVPNRRGLETSLLADKTGESARCIFVTDSIPVGAPNGLRCSFDWASEEPPVNPRTGKKLKPKAPPKRCTKACRQYTPPPPLDPAEVIPYTDADIRDIEMTELGVYLSSTPFDVLPEDVRTEMVANAESAVLPSGPLGSYVLVGALTKKRPYTDSSGRSMGFLAFETERGLVDVTCFSSMWTAASPILSAGKLYLISAERNTRGFTLESIDQI